MRSNQFGDTFCEMEREGSPNSSMNDEQFDFEFPITNSLSKQEIPIEKSALKFRSYAESLGSKNGAHVGITIEHQFGLDCSDEGIIEEGVEIGWSDACETGHHVGDFISTGHQWFCHIGISSNFFSCERLGVLIFIVGDDQ